MHSLGTNHGLVDGNKRLAWVAVRLFYGMNGWDVAASEDEKFDLTMSVASGEYHDVTLAERLRLMAHVVRPTWEVSPRLNERSFNRGTTCTVSTVSASAAVLSSR